MKRRAAKVQRNRLLVGCSRFHGKEEGDKEHDDEVDAQGDREADDDETAHKNKLKRGGGLGQDHLQRRLLEEERHAHIPVQRPLHKTAVLHEEGIVEPHLLPQGLPLGGRDRDTHDIAHRVPDLMLDGEA